jgi:hypothetical protein
MNSIGILSGGGLGRVMAHWVVNGKPDVDVTAMNIDRFHKCVCCFCKFKKWYHEYNIVMGSSSDVPLYLLLLLASMYCIVLVGIRATFNIDVSVLWKV